MFKPFTWLTILGCFILLVFAGWLTVGEATEINQEVIAEIEKQGLSIDHVELFELRLNRGWNMVSIPLNNASIINLDDCVRVTYEWVPQLGRYQEIGPKFQGIREGVGYWMLAERDCYVVAWGNFIRDWPEITFNLPTAGWHMVGAPDGWVELGAVSHNCVITAPVWHWDSRLGDYVRSVRLSEGEGYWMRVDGPCSFSFQVLG